MASTRTLIHTGTLIDGTGAPPLPDGALIVEGIKIVAAGRYADLHTAGMRQIDLRPCTVLPGLIDAHVHIFADAAPLSLWRTQGQTDAQLAIQASANARDALAAGLTTVRDCGGRAAVVRALAQAIDEGIIPGPRIVHSGTPITTTAGHCYFFGLEAQGMTDLQRAVRQLHKAGIDFVKVMVTGGDLTPGSNVRAAQYSQSELCALADDAHRLGYRIAGHAHGTEGIRRAVRAGFDTIEHCS
jgi:imidazolonepropionase-like amidohydrolase